MRLLILVFVSIVAATLVATTLGVDEQDTTQATNQEAQALRTFPSLFDFAKYKQIFHKHYGSLVEELRRRALFVPRVLRIVASGMRYMYRKQEYYTAVNHMTDWTPDEINKMWNKDPELELTKDGEGDDSPGENHKLFDEKSLDRQELKVASSLKSTSNQAAGPPRHLDLNALVKTDDLNQPKRSLSEQIIKVEYKVGIENDTETESQYNARMREHLRPSIEQAMKSRAVTNSKPTFEVGDDEIYVDHSQGGCMDLPRKQGKCGSCWSFVGTAFYEWLYCQKTGELVRFSEQYMIDCIRGHFDSEEDKKGCQGGNAFDVLQFPSNFGLELRSRYPYRAKEQTCPYNDLDDIEKVGYIRVDKNSAFLISVDLWGEYIYFGPIYISILVDGTDFLDYAHGVHELKGCEKDKGSHAMLLVGQGKQDGIEYWKIRNSHSVGWGEGGYYRVSKESNSCMRYYGLSYLTEDGHNFMLDRMRLNPKHQGSLIKKIYWSTQSDKSRNKA